MRDLARLMGLLLAISVQVVRADCDADLATLKTWHETLREEGPGAPIPLLPLTGPTRPSLMKKYQEAGPGLTAPLWVTVDDWVQNGEVVKNGAELRTALRSGLEMNRQLLEFSSPGSVSAPSLPVAFSPDTPWSTVVEVLAAAEAVGMERAILLFAGRSKLKTPPPAPNTALAQNPADWTGWTDGFKRCPALVELSRGATTPRAYRTEWLVSAWGECRCGVPLVDLQNWAWGFMERFHSPPMVDRLLEWKGARARPTLELPAKLPWAEAWKKLEPLLDKAPVVKAR